MSSRTGWGRRLLGLATLTALISGLLLALASHPARALGACDWVVRDEYRNDPDGSTWWRMVVEGHCDVSFYHPPVSSSNPALLYKNGSQVATYSSAKFKFTASHGFWQIKIGGIEVFGDSLSITHGDWQLLTPPTTSPSNTQPKTPPSTPTTTTPKSTPTTKPKSSPTTSAATSKPQPDPQPPSDEPPPGGSDDEGVSDDSTHGDEAPVSGVVGDRFYCHPQTMFLPAGLYSVLCAEPLAAEVPVGVSEDAAVTLRSVCVDVSLGVLGHTRPVVCFAIQPNFRVVKLNLVVADRVYFVGPNLPV